MKTIILLGFLAFAIYSVYQWLKSPGPTAVLKAPEKYVENLQNAQQGAKAAADKANALIKQQEKEINKIAE